MDVKLQCVHKAKRAKQLKARQEILASPRKCWGQSQDEAESSVSKGCSQGGKLERRLASPDASEAVETGCFAMDMYAFDEPIAGTAATSDTVLVSQVMDGMLEDVEVCVKLFYTPHAVSKLPSSFSASGTFQIYETRIGAEGKEYALVAKGEAASHAQAELQNFGNQVIKLRHVNFAHYKDSPQLEVMENMEVVQCSDDEEAKKLEQQLLKRYMLQQLFYHRAEGKPRFSLQMCCVAVQSEWKSDKHGQPFRATRVRDASGMVTNVMVWGGLAHKEHVWERNAVIDIFGAEVHFSEQRLNIRNFSQVELATEASSFRKPAKLTFLK